MADVTTSRVELAPNAGVKEVVLISSTSISAGTDTLTLTLANFGMSQVMSVNGFVHTTDQSVIVAESGTTAVSAGVLTITPAAGNANKRRVYIVKGL